MLWRIYLVINKIQWDKATLKIRDAFAGDVDTATEMFMTKFERPKDQSSKQINKRINKAKSIMDMFND